MVKCDRCGHRVRSKECKENIMVNMIVVDCADNSLIRLTIFQEVLSKAIGSIHESTADEVCEKLLRLENVEIMYNKQMVITEILLK